MEGEKPERQFIMLIGLMGAGKSTYIEEHKEKFDGYVIISMNDIAEEYAKENNFGREWVFENKIDDLRNIYSQKIKEACGRGNNIVLTDGCNFIERRSNYLAIAKDSCNYDYKTTAIVIHPPRKEELFKRLFNRSINEGCTSSFRKLNETRSDLPYDGEFDNPVIEVGNPEQKRLPAPQQQKRLPYWQDKVTDTEERRLELC